MILDGKTYTTCLTCDKVKHVKEMEDYNCIACDRKIVEELLKLPEPRHKSDKPNPYKKKYKSDYYF